MGAAEGAADLSGDEARPEKRNGQSQRYRERVKSRKPEPQKSSQSDINRWPRQGHQKLLPGILRHSFQARDAADWQ